MFDIQRHAVADMYNSSSYDYTRDGAELAYRGKRRIVGNYGRVTMNGLLIFELKSFSSKVTADREDIYIGNAVEQKITGLKGEGEMTIQHVITRNFDEMLYKWQRGHDPILELIGEIADPDTLNGGIERVKFGYIWINELEILKFEKGAVVEKTIPFGFNPNDVTYESVIQETDTKKYAYLSGTTLSPYYT